PLTSSPLSTSLTFMPFFFFVTPTPPNSTLFPYTTLFRSHPRARHALRRAVPSDPHPLAASAAWKRRRHRGHPEGVRGRARAAVRSEEHTSELQSRENLVCRPLLEKKAKTHTVSTTLFRLT